jgi:hypothetical protein
VVISVNKRNLTPPLKPCHQHRSEGATVLEILGPEASGSLDVVASPKSR